jgi:hypothetical protein
VWLINIPFGIIKVLIEALKFRCAKNYRMFLWFPQVKGKLNIPYWKKSIASNLMTDCFEFIVGE